MKINMLPIQICHHKQTIFIRPNRHIAFSGWGSGLFKIKVEKEVDEYYNWCYENPDEKSMREMEEYLEQQYDDDDDEE